MEVPIPVLKAVDAAKCETDITALRAERFYILFADQTAALIFPGGVLRSGAMVAVAADDGELWLGIYRKKDDTVTVEGVFYPHKICCKFSALDSCIRWMFPVLQIRVLCIREKDGKYGKP